MARVIDDIPDVLAAAFHQGIPELDALIQAEAAPSRAKAPSVEDVTRFTAAVWQLFCDQVATELKRDVSVFDVAAGFAPERDCPSCDEPMSDVGGRTLYCGRCGHSEPV